MRSLFTLVKVLTQVSDSWLVSIRILPSNVTNAKYHWLLSIRILPSNVTNAKCQIFGIWHIKHQKQTIMRCAKCQKILRHATVHSHLWHSTDENAKPNKSFFIQFFLSPLNILFNFLSLSLSLSLQPVFSFFLLQIIRFSHPFTLTDLVRPSPSLTNPLTLTLTLPYPHRSSHPPSPSSIPSPSPSPTPSPSPIKLPSSIKPPPSPLVWRIHCRQSEAAIAANLKSPSPHWLICWVGVLLKILSFFLFSFLLRFLDLEFVGGSGDCGCSLWWWLYRWLFVLGWWWLPLSSVFVYCWVLSKYII